MEGRQGCGVGPYPVHPGAQFIHTVAQLVDGPAGLLELAYVHRIGRCRPRCHIVDLVAAHVHLAVLDGDGPVGIPGLHRQPAVVDGGVAGGDAVEAGQVFGQADGKAVDFFAGMIRIVHFFLDHPDVAFPGQAIHLGTASEAQSTAKFHIHFLGCAFVSQILAVCFHILLDLGQFIPHFVDLVGHIRHIVGDFRLHITCNPLHIADIGSIGIIIIFIDILAVCSFNDFRSTTGNIGDLLAAAINAVFADADGGIFDGNLVGVHPIFIDGGIPGLDAAVAAQINILIELHLDGSIIYGRLDVACFLHLPICLVGRVALDLDGLAEILLDNLVSTLLIRRKRKAAALLLIRDGAGNIAELAFCGSPVCHHIVLVPLRVVQACDVIARLCCSISTIRLLAGDGLFPDGNFLGSILAHRDFFKVRGIGHDDFQTVFVCILADTQVLGRSILQIRGIGNAPFDGQGGVQLPGDFLAVVAHEFQPVIHGSHFVGLAIVVFIDNAVHAVFAIIPIGTVHTVLAILHIDVGTGVLAILAGRTGEADMAFASILAIFAIGNADGDAILAIFAFHGNAVFAILARFTVMANDDGSATLGLNGDFAVFAILPVSAFLADSQIVVELDVVGQDSAIIFLGGDHQVAVGGVVIAIVTVFRGGFRRIGLVVNRDHGTLAGGGGGVVDGLADLGQLVFGSCPAADVFRSLQVPVGIGQARCIAARSGLVAGRIDAVLGHIQGTSGKPANLGIPGFQIAFISQIRRIHQLDGQFAIFQFIDADVVLGQLVLIRSAHELELFIELLIDDFVVVTAELQPVVEGGYRMAAVLAIDFILVVLVNDAGDVLAIDTGLAGGTILAGLAFFGVDDGGGNAFLVIVPRYAVFAIDADGASLADFAIRTCYTVLTGLSDRHAVGRNILVHEYMDGGVASCILLYRSQQVLAGIIRKPLRAGAGDVDGAAQLVGYRVAAAVFSHLIGPELQSLAQSFKAANGDIVRSRSIRILDLQGHRTGCRIYFVLAVRISRRIGHQVQVILEHIAQVYRNLLGITGTVYIIAGQFQLLAVIGDRAAGDIIIVEPVDVHILAILAGQVDTSLAILCMSIRSFSIVGNRSAGDIDISSNGSLLDFCSNLLQLIFCSCPAFHDFIRIPVGVLQSGDVIIIIGVGAFRAIRVLAALNANHDAAAVGVIGLDAAHPDRVEPHIVGGGDGHVLRVGCIAGNGDVLALNQVDFRTVRRHGFLLRAVDIQFPALVHRVDDRLDRAAGDVLHIADIGAVGQIVVRRFAICASAIGAAAHVVDLVVPKGHFIAQNDHVLAAVIVGLLDGQAFVVNGGLACLDGLQVCQPLGQFHRQGVCTVGNHADIVVGQVILFLHAAVDGGLLVHLTAKASGICRAIFLDIADIDLAVVHSGQVVDGAFPIMVVETDHAGAAIGHGDVLFRV